MITLDHNVAGQTTLDRSLTAEREKGKKKTEK